MDKLHLKILKTSDKEFKKKLNYAYVGRTYADGLDCEIFDFQSLQKIYKIKSIKRNDKEHVSLYFRKNKP